MLVNITKETKKIKYNGKTRELKPGKGIDLRDFDVANKEINLTEKHIMTKYPGVYEIEKSVGDPERDKIVQKEIDDLAKENEGLRAEASALQEANKELVNKHEAACGEVQAEKERADSLKIEADAANGKVKGLEDEVEKLRLQIAEGKPARKGKK